MWRIEQDLDAGSSLESQSEGTQVIDLNQDYPGDAYVDPNASEY